MSESVGELPNGWTYCTLAELGVWGSGGTPSRKDAQAFGGAIPWLKIGDLPDGPVACSEEFITAHGLRTSSAKLIAANTLLIAMYGASIGKLGLTTTSCATNQAIASCEPYLGIDVHYLFYYALSQRKGFIGLGQGGAQPNISQGILKDYQAKLAPCLEQQRIVSKIDELFSSIDEGERALERVRKLVERYRQSVLKAAVTGELTREWREQHAGELESGEALLTRILEARRQAWEQSELAKRSSDHPVKKPLKIVEPFATDFLGKIPSEWQKVRIDTVGDVQLGRQRSPDHHLGDHMRPYLRVANVYEERIDVRSVMYMNFTPDEYRTFEMIEGDVLLNEGQSKELVGRAAIYRNEVPGCCFTNTLVRFRANAAVLNEYALIVFLHYFKSGLFQKIARITTNIAHLGASRFAEMSFPVPPIREQREILNHVALHSSLYDQAIREVELRKMQTRSLRQSILKAAFRGELVPQDPVDEPASVLLERIAADRVAAPKRGPSELAVAKKRKIKAKA